MRLGLWGGEPLVRDDIGGIIDYAKYRGLYVTLDSNGYLVPSRLRLLRRLDHLIVALDGPEKAHDLNREKGGFDKAMAAIESVSGRIPLWTITVLTKNNLDSVDFVLDKAREYGFLATFQLPHHNDRLGRNHGTLMAPGSSYKRVISKLISEKKNGAPIASSIGYLRHILDWTDYKDPVSRLRRGGTDCRAGDLYCNVDTDGSLYPCSLLIDKVDSLNFLKTGFKEAFLSLSRGPCRSCLASCFTEYNRLYSLDVATILEWVRAMRRTRACLCGRR